MTDGRWRLVHVASLSVGAGQDDRVNLRVVSELGEDLGEERVRLAVVQRDVGRGPDDDHHPLRVDAQPLEHTGVGLEVGQVVLLLQARVLEQLLGPHSEPPQPLRGDGIGKDHAGCQPARDAVLGDRELVVVHVRLGDAQRPRGHREVVGAVGHGQIEPPAPAEPAHHRGALQEAGQLPGPGGAAVAPDRRVIDAVELQQLLRLRVLARGDLHLVTRLTQALDDGPEHEDVRRRADVHPDPHPDPDEARSVIRPAVGCGCMCASRAPAPDRRRRAG